MLTDDDLAHEWAMRGEEDMTDAIWLDELEAEIQRDLAVANDPQNHALCWTETYTLPLSRLIAGVRELRADINIIREDMKRGHVELRHVELAKLEKWLPHIGM